MTDFGTVCVVGLGYIGLPTAAVLASRGARVVGLEINPATVATINRGDVHIVEPDLDLLVREVVESGLLRATETPVEADAFMIAVPTPFADQHVPDLSFVKAAAAAIAPVLKRGDLVVLESTSPVGATERLSQWLASYRPDLSFPHDTGERSDIRVAYCPERVLPGNVLNELVENDRIIGGITQACSKAAAALYAQFVKGERIVTNARTAEMCKLAENSFRDTNIAFANELSIISEKLGIDVWELIRLANRHPRVSILQPGPGVGGHCIAVDPWFIVDSAPDEARLIRTAREVNDSKPHWVLAQVEAAIIEAGSDRRTEGRPTIACLGLSFKPNIDDLRESPALDICQKLASRKDCEILVVEPHIRALPADLAGAAELVDVTEALSRASIILLLVDHTAFNDIAVEALQDKCLIDTRGVLLQKLKASGAEPDVK